MEKGKLIIVPTKAGFAGKIQFTKSDGKVAELPISVFRFLDAKRNGQECEFERQGGVLVKLVVGTDILYPIGGSNKPPQPVPARQSDPFKGAATKQQVPIPSDLPDSMRVNASFLPKDTQEALSGVTTISNFGLKFHKIARFDEAKDNFTFFHRDRKGESYQIKADFGSFPFAALAQKQIANAAGHHVLFQEKKQLDWRLAIGLGIDNVYETGIALHHLYGIPYIPSSSLKGMVRGWIIANVYLSTIPENSEKRGEKAENKAMKDQNFCDIFGCTEKSFYQEARQGKAIFFDAFPTSKPNIEPDVMNPHYAPYYSESVNNAKMPPADYHNPVPIFFLTVKNCAFQFVVSSIEPDLGGKKIDGKTISDWIKDALENHGIGAKTAVGYGYMS